MTDFNLTKLIIHPKWAQAWQHISSEQELNFKLFVQRLPRGLVPSSLMVRDKDGTQIRFALTQEKDIDQLVREMSVILTNQDNAQIEGKVLSIRNDEVTLTSKNKYIKVFKAKSIVSVKDIELNPLVSFLGIRNTNPDIYLQYILNSLSWKIHYSMTLINEREMEISIRAGIVNNSHSSFSSKNIILMAGKASHPPIDSYQLENKRPAALMSKSSEYNSEKKSYSEDLIKVVEFGGVLKPGEMYMNTDKIHQIRYNKLYRHQFSQNRTEIIYRFDSPDQIPSGEVLIYDGSEENFIGSSSVPESNRGQIVNLVMGESSLKITSTIEIGQEVMISSSEGRLKAEEITLEAEFTNPRQKIVPVLLVYNAPRRIVKSNYKYNRKNDYTYEWLVNFQISTDKQIITIKITQVADQSIKEDVISSRQRAELPNRNPPISGKLTNYNAQHRNSSLQNKIPLSMSSIPPRSDGVLTKPKYFEELPEPTQTQTFTPLNTTPARSFSQLPNITIPSDYQRPIEINLSPQEQSEQIPIRTIVRSTENF